MKPSIVLIACVVAVVSLTGCSIIRATQSPATASGTLQGVVTGPSGPVANALVTVVAADATQHASLTNADGYYSIASIPAGPATLSIRANGFSPYDTAVQIVSDPNPNKLDVSLNPQ